MCANVLFLFVIGSGGSGKSTFIKQLKIVYDNGYNDEERKAFRAIIYRNIYENICKITRGLQKLGLKFDNENVKVKSFMSFMSTKMLCIKSKLYFVSSYYS